MSHLFYSRFFSFFPSLIWTKPQKAENVELAVPRNSEKISPSIFFKQLLLEGDWSRLFVKYPRT